METDLIYIVYVSAAAKKFSNEELLFFLSSFKRSNESKGITGMLLYCEEQFIQVLEGPRSTVEQLFEKIKVDPRHNTVLKLFEKPIDQRCFPEWSMGIHIYEKEELAEIEGYSSLQDALKKGDASTQHAHVVFRLLNTFAQTVCFRP